MKYIAMTLLKIINWCLNTFYSPDEVVEIEGNVLRKETIK